MFVSLFVHPFLCHFEADLNNIWQKVAFWSMWHQDGLFFAAFITPSSICLSHFGAKGVYRRMSYQGITKLNLMSSLDPFVVATQYE